MTIYQGWKVVPDAENVQAYPPGAHPPKTPLIKTVTALAVTGQYKSGWWNRGTRWYGVERAVIGPDLRMHVTGFPNGFEEMMAWEDTPLDIARTLEPQRKFSLSGIRKRSGRKSRRKTR